MKKQQLKNTDDIDNSDLVGRARDVLVAYMQANRMRKTPERFAILKAVFSVVSPFDVEDIKERVQKGSFIVSTATIYNTLLLFEKAHIIFRSKPNGRYSKFRVNISFDNHVYLICSNCGTVREIPNDKIAKKIGREKFPGFEASTFSLCVYGLCATCRYNMRTNNTKQKE